MAAAGSLQQKTQVARLLSAQLVAANVSPAGGPFPEKTGDESDPLGLHVGGAGRRKGGTW